VLEESENVYSLADEASKIKSFGKIPLIVITGTGEIRKAEYPSEAMANTFIAFWGEMQSDLLKLSTRSRQVFAKRSGHFVMLNEPEVVIEAIRELVYQAREGVNSNTMK
jgi:hypothetical protein